ncbi:MAG: ROK family protein, partial [Acidimicrobiaceae bacterium]|nr:ROK family protein [Acidimicrobiaceae bacterium]
MSAGLVVGIDMGGTKDNATVLDPGGQFLVDMMMEIPSRVREGPDVAMEALTAAFHSAIEASGVPASEVVAVGLGTPGPASRDGVLSSRGATNFGSPEWWGFDVRGALEARLGLPVVYSNDANAAALYAHYAFFGADGPRRTSVAAIVGTGLGGGLVVDGMPVAGAAGMAGELGHVRIPVDGLLEDGQPLPRCNCGRGGDIESIASLSGIAGNLLPYWLSRYPDHRLAALPIADAAKQVRSCAEKHDPMALRIFDQQAAALGRLFTMLADVIDPDMYFVGGGVVETGAEFRDWFISRVADCLEVREEQSGRVVPVLDGDMAGARGAALAAHQAVTAPR